MSGRSDVDHLSEATRTHILALADKGQSASTIARRLNLGFHVVYRVCRAAGKVRANGTRGAARPSAKLDDAKVLLLRALGAAGASFKSLGSEFGVSAVMAWKVCNGWWSHVADVSQSSEAA